MDWDAIFGLSMSPLELVIRGSAVYWFLVIVFRMVLRRDVGSVGIADVLLLVIIADASQNAMAGEYRTVTDGLILVSTIISWNVLIDWLTFRFPRMRIIFEARELCLIRDGVLQRRNLAREFISEDDIMSKLREQGVEDVASVRVAYLESSGQISVIRRKGAE